MALTRSLRLALIGDVELPSNGFVDDTEAMLCVLCFPTPATPVKVDCVAKGEGDTGAVEAGEAESVPNWLSLFSSLPPRRQTPGCRSYCVHPYGRVGWSPGERADRW